MVDLNSDVGEGFGRWSLGDDDALLRLVSSANVACGFHAGDPVTMRRVCGWAAERGVTIGAQVSYRDLAGFGRRFIDVEPAELLADVVYQVGALDGFARAAGTRVRYVKPHGALYTAVGRSVEQATAVVDAVRSYDPGLGLLGLPGSAWLEIGRSAGLATYEEAFADRGYGADGRLIPRRLPGALITDPAVVARRAVRMVTQGSVLTEDGVAVAVAPASICVHGDTPGAVEIARQVRAALADAGVAVRPFR